MSDLPLMSNGMRFVADENMVEPIRKVETKRWHEGRCYAKRVQKKWTKRYGKKPMEGAYVMNPGEAFGLPGPQVVAMHPAALAKLRPCL